MTRNERRMIPELMDDPGIDADSHHAALRGLRRINQVCRSSSVLWPRLRQLAQNYPRPLRILDVASGGGDVVVSLSQKAHRAGLSMEIDGCDISDQAIDFASQFAQQASPMKNRFFQLNVLDGELPAGYDVVMCSLFLHHLKDDDGQRLMSRMSHACRHAILINDLLRTKLGYGLAWMGCRLLTRSRIVHIDGPRSVQAALSLEEVVQMAERSGVHNPALTRHWPQRFLLSWRRS